MIELFGTLGPACNDRRILLDMFSEGMSGMRLNLSHTSLSQSKDMIAQFHEAASAAGVKAELLIDLQGPELRVGVFETPLLLEEESKIDPALLQLPSEVFNILSNGDHILLDDGALELENQGDRFFVIRGGRLESRKSVKVVDKEVPMPPLTAMDHENLKLANEYGVSAVMQPFVRGAEDLKVLRKALNQYGGESIRIFSKIENRTGLFHLDEILEVSDMIVIARGDLGNDVPLCSLPGVQKDIAHACIKKNVPFLVVTQMATSMISSPVPTRAEVSDIFNAVCDGASALMVTNETAVGKYPAAVIKVLHDTAESARSWLKQQSC